jgi:hypothetical protein
MVAAAFCRGFVSAKPPGSIHALNAVKEPRLEQRFEGSVHSDTVKGTPPFEMSEDVLM